jgi:hypothetical protein
MVEMTHSKTTAPRKLLKVWGNDAMVCISAEQLWAKEHTTVTTAEAPVSRETLPTNFKLTLRPSGKWMVRSGENKRSLGGNRSAKISGRIGALLTH